MFYSTFHNLWQKNKLIPIAIAIIIISLQDMDAQEKKLPSVELTVGKTLMQTIADRHSTREFNVNKEISDTILGQLLWASLGVNRENAVSPFSGSPLANRCNPTAMNSQEITAYVFGKDGVWVYLPESHSLRLETSGDYRSLVAGSEAFSQNYVENAPYSIVFVADIRKLPEKADHKVWAAFDAGIACENLTLACSALGISTVPRATMNVSGIQSLLKLSEHQLPMLNNPIGYAQ